MTIKNSTNLVCFFFILCYFKSNSGIAKKLSFDYIMIEDAVEPFQIVDENIKLKGLFTDIIQELETQLPYQFNAIKLPWFRFKEYIYQHKTSGWISIFSPQWMVKGVKFLKPKLYSTNFIAITGKKSKRVIKNRSDLSNRPLIIVQEWDYPGLNDLVHDLNIEIIKVGSPESAFKMLDEHDFDNNLAFVVYEIRAKYLIHKLMLNNDQFKHFDFSFALKPTDFFIAVSEFEKEMNLNLIEDQIEKMRKVKTINKILNRYQKVDN